MAAIIRPYRQAIYNAIDDIFLATGIALCAPD